VEMLFKFKLDNAFKKDEPSNWELIISLKQ
jgi:hypothetical protein